MESLSETLWDVVICGTGLQQSLLALALSRSDKKVLHIDPNDFYGGPEAAFSLQEAEEWAKRHQDDATAPSGAAVSPPSSLVAAAAAATGATAGAASTASPVFSSASVTRPEPAGSGGGLSFPRAYSLALAPQLIHSRSRLISQLVSSRAFRQLEFLAVGSFFVLSRAPSSSSSPTLPPPPPLPRERDGEKQQEEGETVSAGTQALTSLILNRIPSTREDVFSSTSIPARAKRSLMKFLKFVLEYDEPQQKEVWEAHADSPLVRFLEAQFRLDADLRSYVLALTMCLDREDAVTTGQGLATIHRHLTSMGLFGPGFAAVYPKWGGLSETAQVACRSGAVGGGVYMLGTGIKSVAVRKVQSAGGEDAAVVEEGDVLGVELSNDVTVKTRLLVRGQEAVDAVDAVDAAAPGASASASDGGESKKQTSRLIAVVGSPLAKLFETTVEGAPTPAVAVIACSPGSLDASQEYPVYIMVHSSDTGECPAGQSLLYLFTRTVPGAKQLLEHSVGPILAAVCSSCGTEAQEPPVLFQLYYEQSSSASSAASPEASSHLDGRVFTFPLPSAALAFDDAILDPVQEAWRVVVGAAAEEADSEFMRFTDREGVGDDDDDV